MSAQLCVCVHVCVCVYWRAYGAVMAAAGLAWQIINDLWLHPCVHLDASHEDRSPFFLPPAHTLELIRQADAILSKEPNILNIEGPTKLFGTHIAGGGTDTPTAPILISNTHARVTCCEIRVETRELCARA